MAHQILADNKIIARIRVKGLKSRGYSHAKIVKLTKREMKRHGEYPPKYKVIRGRRTGKRR